MYHTLGQQKEIECLSDELYKILYGVVPPTNTKDSTEPTDIPEVTIIDKFNSIIDTLQLSMNNTIRNINDCGKIVE